MEPFLCQIQTNAVRKCYEYGFLRQTSLLLMRDLHFSNPADFNEMQFHSSIPDIIAINKRFARLSQKTF